MAPGTAPRIALIHATALAVDPIQAAFARHWPQARRMNLLDDSLSADHAAAQGQLTDAMTGRFVTLARYAVGTGCDALLFTCSAFGPAIEAAGRATGRLTLKPNEAMFAQALATTPRGPALQVGLVATFPASLPPMAQELREAAAAQGRTVVLHELFVPKAMDDLAQGRAADHHRKIAAAAAAAPALAACDVVMLAQFSMAAAQSDVQAALPCPVLTSPDCAVLALKERMTRDA